MVKNSGISDGPVPVASPPEFPKFPTRMLDDNEEIKILFPGTAPEVYTKDNEQLGYINFPPPHALFEFPVRRLRNINSVVKIIRPVRWSDDYHYGVDTRSDTFLGDLFVPFGKVNEFERDFLGRFNQKRKSPYYCWIRFRTLLVGYQLFKRDPEQFRNALKTAKDEEEFCILAGVS